MFSVIQRGSFKNLKRFMNNVEKGVIFNALESYGRQGVEALQSMTPVDSGITSASWYYKIEQGKEVTRIIWYNSNINKGVNIAIILQYGHGTGTGGYVAGRDYINPAVQPVMDRIADKVWKAVENA